MAEGADEGVAAMQRIQETIELMVSDCDPKAGNGRPLERALSLDTNEVPQLIHHLALTLWYERTLRDNPHRVSNLNDN